MALAPRGSHICDCISKWNHLKMMLLIVNRTWETLGNTLNDSSIFSPPQTSSPGSYVPIYLPFLILFISFWGSEFPYYLFFLAGRISFSFSYSAGQLMTRSHSFLSSEKVIILSSASRIFSLDNWQLLFYFSIFFWPL